MDYTPEQLDAAFAADEVARYTFLLGGGPQRPQYSGLQLAAGVLDEPAEPLTFEDVDAAVAELSALRGEDYADTYAQVRSLAGGERDLVSLTAGIIELASGSGSSSAGKGDHLRDLMRRNPEYFGGEEEEEGEEKKESSGRRRRGRNQTPESMGIGTEAASGDVQAAARQRWARAGVVSLSADEDPDELELAQSDAEGGPIEDLVRRYSEYFGDGGFAPAGGRPRSGRGFRPARPGRVTTGSRAHRQDTDPTVRSHPSRGGAPHPEVERYIGMLHSGGFGGRERPDGSVVHHRRRAA